MINPKTALAKDAKALKFVQELTVNDQFLGVLQVALAQMVINQPSSANVSAAWDNNSKIQGAKEFITTLLNLGEPDQPLPRLPDKNLKPVSLTPSKTKETPK